MFLEWKSRPSHSRVLEKEGFQGSWDERLRGPGWTHHRAKADRVVLGSSINQESYQAPVSIVRTEEGSDLLPALHEAGLQLNNPM